MKTEADWQSIAREEMRFFGSVSAAISHEINNRFAVINEKAGLLQDLAGMMVRGKEVDPERIQVQSGKIAEQVRMAKLVVKNLNRFAHSVDVEQAEVDVTELIEFVTALYSRKAEMADARLKVTKSPEPAMVTTSPFALEALIGRGIEIALSTSGESRVVAIDAHAISGGVVVRFGGLEGLGETLDFPEAAKITALLECLEASVRSEADGTALLLEIPDQQLSLHGRTA
jgi:C4-dicarboxylate-specific signal transduction histidine kinase